MTPPPRVAVVVVVAAAHGNAAGRGDSVDVVKEWNTIATLEGHSKAVTSLKFGPDSSVLLSASMDRSIKIWS
jgi:WD40 repeat protein